MATARQRKLKQKPFTKCLPNPGKLTLPARSAVGLRGLSTGHPALTPNWPASLPATLRAFPPPARRFRGAPGRATRILRVLFRRARSPADQEQSRSRARVALALAFQLFSFSPSAGHDGPLLYPGPLCGGEAGTTGRAAGVDRDVGSFSPGQDALSKSPAPAHELAGQDARQAPSGVPLSLVTFSRASERK